MNALRGLTIVLVASAAACAADSTYGSDRLADLGDIFDLRYGRSMGLGVKLEASYFLGVGLGVGGLIDVTESFGRDEMHWDRSSGFFHLVLVGWDGEFGSADPGPPGTWDLDILGVNWCALGLQKPPETVNWFRFGGELLLPFVTGGIYLNVGQLVDGVAGIATLDPAEDDRATELERERRREEALRTDASRTPPQGQN